MGPLKFHQLNDLSNLQVPLCKSACLYKTRSLHIADFFRGEHQPKVGSEGTITRVSCNPTVAQNKKGALSGGFLLVSL